MSVIRLDDVSPMIHFDDAWLMGTTADPLMNRYSDGGTFHATTGVNAKATIQFNGTGISIYGARRGNHDLYTVKVDGQDTIGNGTGNDLFNEVLFSNQNLGNGAHSVEIWDSSTQTDRQRAWLDVDYVVIATQIAANQYVIDHNFFQYSPADAWSTLPNALSDSELISMHMTQRQGSTATVTFTGSGINLYGVVCQSCGTFSVTLDGVQQSTLPFDTSTNRGQWLKQNTPFFFARNLPEGQHVLSIMSLDNTAVAVQNAVIFSASPPPSNPGGSGSQPAGANPTQGSNGSTPGKHSNNVAAIVGGTLGGAAFALLIIAVFLLVSQRRHRKSTDPHAAAVTPTNNPATGPSQQPWTTSGPYSGPFSPEFVLAAAAPGVLPAPHPWAPESMASSGAISSLGGGRLDASPVMAQPPLTEKQQRQMAMRAFDHEQASAKVPPAYH